MNLFLSSNAGTVGLLFFFVIFTGIAIWAYLPRNREKLEAHKFIPIKGGEHE